MALKAYIDTIDAIPEPLREHYTEQDGKFVLALDEDVKAHPLVKNLQSAFERVKADKQKLATDFAALRERVPEDFDPDEYARLKDAGPGKIDEKLAAQREALTKKFTADIQAKEAKIADLTGLIHREKVDGGLTAALVEAGVAKEYMPAVKALLKDRVKLDDQFNAIAETDMGATPLPDFAKSWVATDEGKAFVAKPSGAGAKGGEGQPAANANPWAKESYNLTQQGKIINSDRAKAERLMKAAGLTQVQIQARLGGY
jgi:hypothetical protein